jgi:hypothetical protein
LSDSSDFLGSAEKGGTGDVPAIVTLRVESGDGSRRPMAGPALGAIPQALARHTVARVAMRANKMRANNMYRVGHDVLP